MSDTYNSAFPPVPDAVPPDDGDESTDLDTEATVADGIGADWPDEDDPNEQEVL